MYNDKDDESNELTDKMAAEDRQSTHMPCCREAFFGSNFSYWCPYTGCSENRRIKMQGTDEQIVVLV